MNRKILSDVSNPKVAVFTENVFYNAYLVSALRQYDIECKELNTINNELRKMYFVIEDENYDFHGIVEQIKRRYL